MSGHARAGLSLAGYFAAFACLTFPLVLRPTEAVMARWSPDLEHSFWAQWWFETALDSPEHDLFRTRMIGYPQVVDLQLADLNLAVNGPVTLFGRLGDPALAYNLALLASFLLAAVLLQRLVARQGASPSAAWVAGLLFAGSPYWMASALNGWCYLVHTWTLPLVFGAALSLRERPGLRSGAALGLALGLTFHVTPYYLLYSLVLLGTVALFRSRDLRDWWREPASTPSLLAAGALLTVIVAPRAVGMVGAATQELVVHHEALNTALAAPLLETVWPSAEAVDARIPRVGYLVVFVGWATLGAIALSLRLAGRCPGVAVWWGAAGVSLLLALGPWLKLSEASTTPIPLPGLLLQQLPGFDMTTNHWRWVLPASFCLTIVLARSLTSLQDHFARSGLRGGRLLAPICVAVYALEAAWVWPLPFPRPLSEVRPSPVAALLRDRPDVDAVLDRTDRRKLNQTVHGKPIALGWLPRVDVEVQRENQRMLAACAGQGPACLHRYGIDAVIRDDRTALLLDDQGRVVEVLRSDP